jgi:hypothetical protein
MRTVRRDARRGEDGPTAGPPPPLRKERPTDECQESIRSRFWTSKAPNADRAMNSAF